MTEFEALIEDIRNHGVREVLNDEEVIDNIKELEVTSKAFERACELLYEYLPINNLTVSDIMEFLINDAERRLEKRR